MEDFLDLLGSPVYQHVLINHVPVTGLFVGALVLGVAITLRQRPALIAALGLAGMLAVTGLLAHETGERAYPVMYDEVDGHGQAWLDHHAALADRFTWLFFAAASSSFAGVAVGIWRPSALRGAALVALALSLASLLAAAVVAESGGKIRHPEFRLSPPPDTPYRGGRPGDAVS